MFEVVKQPLEFCYSWLSNSKIWPFLNFSDFPIFFKGLKNDLNFDFNSWFLACDSVFTQSWVVHQNFGKKYRFRPQIWGQVKLPPPTVLRSWKIPWYLEGWKTWFIFEQFLKWINYPEIWAKYKFVEFLLDFGCSPFFAYNPILAEGGSKFSPWKFEPHMSWLNFCPIWGDPPPFFA